MFSCFLQKVVSCLLQYMTHMSISCRFELYLGEKHHAGELPPADNKTGPAAVIRNMRNVLEHAPPAWCLIVIDRFYTSVALLLQLLTMRLYSIGTIRTNRIGYYPAVVNCPPPRTHNLERGEFRMARSVDATNMIALSWMDKKAVRFLSTGASGAESSVNRWSGRAVDTVKAPKLV